MQEYFRPERKDRWSCLQSDGSTVLLSAMQFKGMSPYCGHLASDENFRCQLELRPQSSS